MKIMIVSDTHRMHKNLKIALDRMAPIDRLLHLGDAEGYEDYIAELARCPLDIVAGNNDFFSALEYEKIIQIAGYRILMTHGHYYYVDSGIRDLVKAGRAHGANIVVYGHTHRPMIERMDNLFVLNPGSLTYPRQEGKQPSFLMMEIGKDGEAHFSIHYLPAKK